MEQEWLSVIDVATLFGVGRSTVYDQVYRSADPLPHGYFGGKLVFNKADVEAWVRRDRRPQPVAVEAPAVVKPELPHGRRGPKPGRGSVADLFA